MIRCQHGLCSGQAGRSILRRLSTAAGDTVKEGDIIILKSGPPKDFSCLSKRPLRHGNKIETHFGVFNESDIIGKPYRELISPSKPTGRKGLRVHPPTLEEYIKHTRRQVTPIYAQDANLIASLLDIHVTPSSVPKPVNVSPGMEILEAGTGHGSLTIQLARQIQAANPPLPPSERPSELVSKSDPALAAWKKTRHAVIHSVERNKAYSDVAQKMIANFRHGLYAPHIDFHTGDVHSFIEAEIARRSADGSQKQLFDHIILDLPDTHHCIRQASKALKDGGTLIVFCPSITQIAQCVRVVREFRLPLSYTDVLELGTGLSGGRQWDVRAAKLKDPGAMGVDTAPMGLWTRLARWIGWAKEDRPLERWEMVARPKVGRRVVGGGFLGIWHRKRKWELHEEESDEVTDQRAAEEVPVPVANRSTEQQTVNKVARDEGNEKGALRKESSLSTDQSVSRKKD